MIYKTIDNYKDASKDFLENEKQFHLGVIDTEKCNPLTKNLSYVIADSTVKGVQTIYKADKYIADKAASCFETEEFKFMVSEIKRAMDQGKKVVFSSVGASGRMAITLDSDWRKFWNELTQVLPERHAQFAKLVEVVSSFTTGGDRALVRSVENFEDYMTFGAQQVIEADIHEGDVLVGLSECGLSASINGSVLEGIKQGCSTFYLFCNKKATLCKYLDRVRVVFKEPKIVKIPLFVGNMAVAGSTRMQVTTVELLVAGAALELASKQWLEENLTKTELSVLGTIALEPQEYAEQFRLLSKQLSSGKTVKGIAAAVDFEAKTYEQKGLVTYVTHDYLLDIMTDTTERQPTFTLPPFKRFNEVTDNLSWAYIKDPLYPSDVAWQHVFRRPVKGLDWTAEDYIRMKAEKDIINNPPKVGSETVFEYNIGNEDDPSRYSRKVSELVVMDINGSANEKVMEWFNANVDKYSGGLVIRIGKFNPKKKLYKNEIHIPVDMPFTCQNIMYHLAIKLIFNTLSTATMAKMGRVWGNWMIQVLPTNKKLIDRSTRIIANLANIPYEQANLEFFKSYYGRKPEDEYKESYVVETLNRLGVDRKTGKITK